ncbi:hypothetical protein SHAb15599_00097 [Acinetobacter phage SH-Ab 15599]|nr:hypothetical protein SHAb15599_00097 [Acinetobacter phage SH-Ab 15599]
MNSPLTQAISINKMNGFMIVSYTTSVEPFKSSYNFEN